MSLSVTALPGPPAIQIRRSLGGGGFQAQAGPLEAGAIFDALQTCLCSDVCDRGGEYEGDAAAGAIALHLMPALADTASATGAARVFIRKRDDGTIVLRFVTDQRPDSLDLDEEEARNLIVALREVARELVEGQAPA